MLEYTFGQFYVLFWSKLLRCKDDIIYVISTYKNKIVGLFVVFFLTFISMFHIRFSCLIN